MFFVSVHALIVRDGLVLVTRRSSTQSYGPGKWDLPGGVVEVGETLQQALVREVREETGLDVRPGRVILMCTDRDLLPVRQDFQGIFECADAGGDVVQSDEHDGFAWLRPDQLAALDSLDFLAVLAADRSLLRECIRRARQPARRDGVQRRRDRGPGDRVDG